VNDAVLDNPVWAALTGPHSTWAVGDDRARRYPKDVAPFAAMADPTDPRCWESLATIVGDDPVALPVGIEHRPAGWRVTWSGSAVQMVAGDPEGAADPAAVELGERDVPAILDLVERTQPGPFRARTVELGSYLGVRRAGALVALAGERMHPPGWTEISAVCTDPSVRGQGLATRLVRAVTAGIAVRGEGAVLHVVTDNTPAIRLYESLGFEVRRTLDIGGAIPVTG